jgi:hypothetical protein
MKIKTPAWQPNMTPDQRRIRHTIRMFKQGWRMFRIGSKGTKVRVVEIDVAENTVECETLRGRLLHTTLDKLYIVQVPE